MAKRLRVLLIEDSKDDALLLLRELKKSGYEVSSERYQDAVGVRKALDNPDWDLVISDYVMPNFTGRDALEIMKEKKIDLPFIIVSGTIGEETAVDAMRAGAQDFLIKRNLKRLAPVIERELREVENRRERDNNRIELRLWEDRFTKAFQSSPIPTVIFTLAHRTVTDANVRFLEMAGLKREELNNNLNFDLLDLWVDESDYKCFHSALKKNPEGILDRETRINTVHGENVALVSTERIDLGGQQCILAMFYDITERRRAVDRLQRMQEVTAALSEARTPAQVAEVVVNQVAAGTGATGVVVAVTEDEGDTLNIVDATGYDEAVITRWRRMSVNGPDMPLCMAVMDGSPVWIPSREDDAYLTYADSLGQIDDEHESWVALPMIKEGHAFGGICLSFDAPQNFDTEVQKFIITMADYCTQAMERAILYVREQEARKVAEQANELKLKFLAMISHELRTPLMSIKGCASTLLATDVTWSQEDQNSFLNSIDHEADKLADLVDQLLEGSRIQSGTLKVEPAPQDVMDIIRFAMAQVHSVIQQHHLDFDIPDDLPMVQADAHRISQVMVNLVENATKYAEPHTTITLCAREKDEFVQFEVSDEGIGIGPEDEDTIFEFFAQVNRPQGFRQGTGLGLTICKGLVEAHGGKIWVKQDGKPGATLAFTLPIAYT